MKWAFVRVTLILATLLSCTITILAREITEPLQFVGTRNNAPFSFTLPDGTHTGLYVEFWKLWSKTNDIPIEITLVDFNSSLTTARNGEAVHMGLFINEKRNKWADFSLPIHSVDTGVLYNHDYAGTTKLVDSPGLSVAVQSNTFQADFLIKNMPFLDLSFYDEINIGFDQLLNNDAVAIVAEIPSLQVQLHRRGLEGVFNLSSEVLFNNTVHATILKGRPQLMALINQGITNIPIDSLINLEHKWLPQLNTFFGLDIPIDTLTTAEKGWLKLNNSFSLGIEHQWRPVEYLDKNGDLKGITADYMEHFSKELKLNFLTAKEYSWSEAFDALKEGKIDVMSGVVANPERAKQMLFTDPYFEIHTVIVIHKDSLNVGSLDDLQTKKMAVVRGYIVYDSITNEYPDANITQIDSVLDGLKLVDSGEVDAFIGTLPVIMYEKNKHKLDRLFVAGYVPYKYHLSIAVRKGLEPLVSILNKTMAKMDEGQRSAIANKWLSIHVQRGTDLKVFLFWVLPILIGLFFIILFVVRINARLKQEIAIREQSELEREFLKEQLHQSQKMEALGKLIGGIAHDFNNMLGIILGYSALLKSKMQKDDKLIEYVDEIHRAGSRGANLTSKLLSYTRKQSLESTKVDLNKLLSLHRNMLEKMLTVRINLILEIDEDIWPVWTDSSEFDDSILNISINAMHAMDGRQTGAKLTIQTRNLSLNENQAALIGLESGDYVQVNINDNGCGMDKELQDRIFEPFFSTKADKGTGLGLSQVYGFMQRSFGTIKVYSEVGVGSQFVLFFPRFEDQLEEESLAESKDELLTGTETILIVDDESALRHLAEELLREQGYHTLVAESGQQALDILKTHSIDLILSDIIMPKMDGYQLAALVKERYPQIKVQLVSGYTDKSFQSEESQALSKNLLYKPYDPQKLFKVIRRLLDN